MADILGIQRGGDITLRFTFPAGTDLTGSTAVFTAAWHGGSMRRDNLVLDVAARSFALALTPAETRALPTGKLTRYELELRQFGRQTIVQSGMIETQGGLNDD